MDGSEFLEAVRDAKATPLDRLGSEKALVAATDAVLEPDVVLTTAAANQGRVRDTLRAWAGADPSPRARQAFAKAADRADDHYDLLVEHLDEEPAAHPGAVHGYLRGLEATSRRIGAGFVGYPLVESRELLQVVNFFVNEADASMADLIREVRADADARAEEGTSLLEAVCEGEDDWADAREAAEETIQVAYDEYVETLEEMGLDPRPVC